MSKLLIYKEILNNKEMLINLFFIFYLIINIYGNEYNEFIKSFSLYFNIFFIIFALFFLKNSVFSLTLSLIIIFGYFLVQFFKVEGFLGFISIVPPILFAGLFLKGLIRPGPIYIFFIFIVIYYVYLGFFLDLEPESFGRSSRNSLAYITLSISTLYFLAHFIRGTISSSTLLIPVLSVLVAIFAYGRSGIVLTIAFLIMMAFVKFKNYLFVSAKEHIKSFRFYINITLLVIIFYYININFGIINSQYEFFLIRWGNPYEDIRWILLAEFIEKYEFYNLLSGFDFNQTSYIADLDGNPHNSYIELLANYAFIGFFILILLAFNLFKFILRGEFVIIIICTPFFVRIFFDAGGFHNVGLIITSIFLMYKNRKYYK